MEEKQRSNGKLAYKLYNKVGANEKEKAKAKKLIENEDLNSLDAYGKFVHAEIIFWDKNSTASLYNVAIEIFQGILLNKQSPKPLIVGACFFVGRMYELGLGVNYNLDAAYAHYRLANKLNPKACTKDIARLQKIQGTDPKTIKQSTPDKYKYKYNGIVETGSLWEYNKYLEEWATEYEKCKTSLKDNKFFYADDPDEVNVDD